MTYAEILSNIGMNQPNADVGGLKVLCPKCREIKTAIRAGSAIKCECGHKVTEVDDVECRS